MRPAQPDSPGMPMRTITERERPRIDRAHNMSILINIEEDGVLESRSKAFRDCFGRTGWDGCKARWRL